MDIENKLEQKAKIIDTKEMPTKIFGIFAVENFSFAFNSSGATNPKILDNIFPGREFYLGTTPSRSDSGHNQWKAIHWYEEQGIKQDEYFLSKVNIEH